MKIKKIVFSFVGAALAVGAIVGALVPAKDAKSVGAAAGETLAEGEVLLRIVHEGETTDEEIIPTLKVYNWNDGGNNGWPGKPIEEFNLSEKRTDGRYTFTLPKVEETGVGTFLRDKFIITGDGDTQTGDSAWMGLDATHEFTLTINAAGGVVGGGWNKIVQPYTSDMLRIWVDRGLAAHEQGYLMLHYWKDGVDAKTLAAGYTAMTRVDEVDHWLAYYDVPKADLVGAHMQFIRHESTGVWAQTFNDSREGGEANVYAAGDNAEIYYLWENGTQFARGSLASQESIVPVANLKLVFEGYFSCAEDMDNGYLNWGKVKSTWITYTDEEGAEHWRTAGDLTDLPLNDFDTEADYATGNRNKEIDAWTKYQMMEALYDANLPSNLYGVDNGSFDDTAIIIASVTLLSVVSVSAIVFIGMKKRRLNK